MSIFSMSKYEKEGPGVYEDNLPKSGIKLFFFVLLNRFWRLIGLNILFVIFSLPIITIPAAAAAQSKVLCDMLDLSYVQLFKDFWKAFVGSLLNSIIYGLITAALLFMGYAANIYYLQIVQGAFAVIGIGAVLATLFIWSMMALYIPIMIGTIELGLKSIIGNAFRLVFVCFFRNLLTWGIVGAIIFAMVFTYPASVIPMLVLMFALLGLIICFNSWPVIKQYVVQAEPEADLSADA